MKLICPDCGEEVRNWDYMDHKCAPSTENVNHKEEQKYGFVEVLKEFLEYSFLTSRVYMALSVFWSSRHDEKKDFDNLKSFLYNTSTIIILFWLISLLMSEFLLVELGEVLGFIVLVSPPFLIYFAIYFMVKGKDTYTSIFMAGHILILFFYGLMLFGFIMFTR